MLPGPSEETTKVLGRMRASEDLSQPGARPSLRPATRKLVRPRRRRLLRLLERLVLPVLEILGQACDVGPLADLGQEHPGLRGQVGDLLAVEGDQGDAHVLDLLAGGDRDGLVDAAALGDEARVMGEHDDVDPRDLGGQVLALDAAQVGHDHDDVGLLLELGDHPLRGGQRVLDLHLAHRLGGELDLGRHHREHADLHVALLHHLRGEEDGLAALLRDQVRGDDRELGAGRQRLQAVDAEGELTLADADRVVADQAHDVELEVELGALILLGDVGREVAGVEHERVAVLDLRAVDEARDAGEAALGRVAAAGLDRADRVGRRQDRQHAGLGRRGRCTSGEAGEHEACGEEGVPRGASHGLVLLRIGADRPRGLASSRRVYGIVRHLPPGTAPAPLVAGRLRRVFSIISASKRFTSWATSARSPTVGTRPRTSDFTSRSLLPSRPSRVTPTFWISSPLATTTPPPTRRPSRTRPGWCDRTTTSIPGTTAASFMPSAAPRWARATTTSASWRSFATSARAAANGSFTSRRVAASAGSSKKGLITARIPTLTSPLVTIVEGRRRGLPSSFRTRLAERSGTFTWPARARSSSTP